MGPMDHMGPSVICLFLDSEVWREMQDKICFFSFFLFDKGQK